MIEKLPEFRVTPNHKKWCQLVQEGHVSKNKTIFCHISHELRHVLSLFQDYDDFDLANEDDELEEFLGIPRKTPKSNPVTKQNGHAEGGEGEGEAATNG